jgi:tryptophan synthase alpha chain
MNRIDTLFARLKKERRKAFIVYITAGDPDIGTTKRLVGCLAQSGADLVELGIPFSDPLADGLTIQRASQRALAKGANVKAILKAVKEMRKKVQLPIVFMTYYNPVAHYGVKRFVRDAKAAGADGIIVPDLPPEEAQALIAASRKEEFATVFLAAPTSTRARLKRIARDSRGFIYYVSLTGVTGARARLPRDIIKNVKALKRITDKPVCVGFGISQPSQAKRIARLADGIIVGSAVIRVIEKNKGKSGLYGKVARFVKALERAVHETRT